MEKRFLFYLSADSEFDDFEEGTDSATAKKEDGDKEKVASEDHEVTLKMSDLRRLISEQVSAELASKNSEKLDSKSFASELAKALDSISNKDAKNTEGVLMPEEDLLEIPVMYFSPSVGTTIYASLKRGVKKPPPYGKIRFDVFQRTVRNKDSKRPTYSSICTYLCHSKKVKEFLDSHEEFGVRFFSLNEKGKRDEDLETMHRIKNAYDSISGMSNTELVKAISKRGLSPSVDLMENRKILSRSMADEKK